MTCPHGVDLTEACYCQKCDDADGTTEAVAAMSRIGSAARREREAQEARDRMAHPVYVVYRCPVCFEQKPGPDGHHVAGDNICQGVGPDGTAHTAKLERITVVPLPGGALLDERDAALTMLRDAWNAHMAACPLHAALPTIEPPSQADLDAWRDAPSGTASADLRTSEVRDGEGNWIDPDDPGDGRDLRRKDTL